MGYPIYREHVDKLELIAYYKQRLPNIPDNCEYIRVALEPTRSVAAGQLLSLTNCKIEVVTFKLMTYELYKEEYGYVRTYTVLTVPREWSIPEHRDFDTSEVHDKSYYNVPPVIWKHASAGIH